jgi:hypothetical protein
MSHSTFRIYREPVEDGARPARPASPRALVPNIQTAVSHAGTIDDELLAILNAPPARGETIEMTFRRKELELGDLFATLTVFESRTLQRRLSNPSANDPVAAQFGRLVPERRSRLLAFLGDVRRREAVMHGRQSRRAHHG